MQRRDLRAAARRLTLCAALVVALSPATECSAAANAVAYPTKPIRLIVPYPPGGGNDIIARAIAERIAERVGQQVVVDNRGGAATVIGAEIAAKASNDGYTLLLGTVTTLAVNPNLKARLPYHPTKDFEPVSMVASQPYLLVVHPGIAAASVKELIALARAKPGQLNFSSPGTGSNGHLAGELFQVLTDTRMVHVPYKGTGPAVNDLLGGHVSMMFATMPSVQQHVKAGRLRALGVSTAKRSPAMPDIPTIAEAGVRGYEMVSWNGLLAPRGTPQSVLAKVHRELEAALKVSELRERLLALGFDPEASSPRQFAAYIRSEIARYAKLIKAAGIRIE